MNLEKENKINSDLINERDISDKSNLFKGIMLFSDVDGTLVDTNKNLPPQNLEAVARFKEMGGLFTLASGRCANSIRDFAQAAGINCPVITLNGVVVYDFEKEEVVSQDFLPPSFLDVIKEVDRVFPDVGIQAYVNSDVYVGKANDIIMRLHTIEKLPWTDTTIDGLPTKVNKVLFGHKPHIISEVGEYLKGKLPKEIYGLHSESVYFELLPENRNKGVAAKIIADKFGIPYENTVAIGDYYNDIDMLKSVSYPIATGNAPYDVKCFGRYITCHCDEGAVADAVDHLEKRILRKGHL